MKDWTRNTIPSSYFFADGDRSYRYHAATVALFEIADRLAQYIGTAKCSLVKAAIRDIAPELVRAWPDPRPRVLTIQCGDDFTMQIHVGGALQSARSKVAALSL